MAKRKRDLTNKIIIAIFVIIIVVYFMFLSPTKEKEDITTTKPITIKSTNSFYCEDVFGESWPWSIGKCNLFSIDEFFIFGMLENPNSIHKNVEIYYTLYDKNKIIIGSGKGILYHDEIPSDQTVPFMITTTDISGIESYKIEVREDKHNFNMPYREFEKININMKKEEDSIKIGGEIKNIGNKISEHTIVLALLYNSEGKIIDLLVESTNPLDINPGETASFVLEETYSEASLNKIKSYELWIQGIY